MYPILLFKYELFRRKKNNFKKKKKKNEIKEKEENLPNENWSKTQMNRITIIESKLFKRGKQAPKFSAEEKEQYRELPLLN